jgi:hypothetical protein
MDPELEAKLDAVRQSPFVDIRAIQALAEKADSLRQASPKDCLRIFQVLAETVGKWEAGSANEKIAYFTKASAIGWEIDHPNVYIDLACAKLHASIGDNTGAGHFFRQAAGAFARDMQLGKEKPEEWTTQENLLREAEAHFARAGAGDAAAACHYERMILTRDRHPHMAERAKQWFLWALWGWGERPWRVVACGAILIVLYALGDWAVGISPSDADRWINLGNSLYLSVITFTTLRPSEGA